MLPSPLAPVIAGEDHLVLRAVAEKNIVWEIARHTFEAVESKQEESIAFKLSVRCFFPSIQDKPTGEDARVLCFRAGAVSRNTVP